MKNSKIISRSDIIQSADKSIISKIAYISFNKVYKRYQMGDITINAANGVNFYINKGEFAAIVGMSGAGKTTVLNMLGGIDQSDEGIIMVDGKCVSGLSDKELVLYRRYDIGFVFQFYNLVPNLTARENVELASEIAGSDADIDSIMKSVGLEERADNFPAQLSGGEQQRVAIARALAKKPKLLLCDEPTGALDDDTGKKILELLYNTCKQENMTVVLITHNTAVTPMADRVIRMKNGTVISNTVNKNPIPIGKIEW